MRKEAHFWSCWYWWGWYSTKPGWLLFSFFNLTGQKPGILVVTHFSSDPHTFEVHSSSFAKKRRSVSVVDFVFDENECLLLQCSFNEKALKKLGKKLCKYSILIHCYTCVLKCGGMCEPPDFLILFTQNYYTDFLCPQVRLLSKGNDLWFSNTSAEKLQMHQGTATHPI